MKTHYRPQSYLLSALLLGALGSGPADVTGADLSWRRTTLNAFGDDMAVAVHPDGSFLAADGFDIDRSVNFGTNWTTVSGFATFAGGSFAIDPSDPTILYAGRSHGLLKSSDGGLSWFELADLHAGGPANALAIAPSDPATVFAGVGSGWGVYKSRNRGGTWNQVLQSRDVESLAVHPYNSLIVLAGTVLYSPNQGGLLRTENGGTNWLHFLSGMDVTAVVFDSANPPVAYAGTIANGIFRSLDGGQTWELLPASSSLGPITALVVHPANPQQLFVAVNAGGTYSSNDRGLTWKSQNAGLSDQNVVALAIRSVAPYTLAAATYGGQVFWANPELLPPNPEPPTLSLAQYAGISIAGQIGATYQIQSTTNLDNPNSWRTLTNLTLPHSPYLFFDATSNARSASYYRALLVP